MVRLTPGATISDIPQRWEVRGIAAAASPAVPPLGRYPSQVMRGKDMNAVSPSNFGHLKAHDEHLIRLGQLAERYFPDDPNTCLLKLQPQLTAKAT